MKKTLAITAIIFLIVTTGKTQVATQVIDEKHNETTTVETVTKSFSAGLKQVYTNPFFEKISKVQKFLKEAVNIVSAVVANLKMTRQLIETEQDIYELYTRSVTKIAQAENLPDKWKHKKVIVALFHESVQAFEVFDIATQQNKGIIDDRGRIELIKQVLQKTKKIKMGMRIALRRANHSIFKYKRKKKDFEVFKKLFN